MSTTFIAKSVEHTERPWGWYESIDEASYDNAASSAAAVANEASNAAPAASHNKVKRFQVRAGQRLSLQTHARRAEHWLVVRGVAHVTLGNADGSSLREFDLHPGQYCDIAIGQIHRVANLGTEPVEIIEVQMGSYVGEDDITRLQDDFGRV
jgi:mannose-6-phosphate isomerase